MDADIFAFLGHAIEMGVLCGTIGFMLAPVVLVVMGVLGIHLMG